MKKKNEFEQMQKSNVKDKIEKLESSIILNRKLFQNLTEKIEESSLMCNSFTNSMKEAVNLAKQNNQYQTHLHMSQDIM